MSNINRIGIRKMSLLFIRMCWTLVVVTALSVGVLAGCGSGDNDTNTNTEYGWKDSLPVVQFAFSVHDIERTMNWYKDIFGYYSSGGQMAEGEEVAAMMGLSSVTAEMGWLVDTSDLFQLEFFEFSDPVSKAGSRTPQDAGWVLIGVQVEDIDHTIAKLTDAGAPIGTIIGAGDDRRFCTQDPEGAWIEVSQRKEKIRTFVREAPVTSKFVRAVVSDIEEARRWADALNLVETNVVLHADGDEVLWNGEPAQTETAVFSDDPSGDGILLEVVQYLDRTPKPLPEGYKISDQGMLNIAFGTRSRDVFANIVETTLVNEGWHLHKILAFGPAAGSYGLGPDGLSAEYTAVGEYEDELTFGWRLP